MKKRKLFTAVTVLLLLLTVLFTGCGKGAPGGDGNGSTGDTGGFVSASGDRKIVYSASLTLSVKEVGAGVDAVTALLPGGSYLESRTVYDDRAYLVLRVKTTEFDAFLRSLSGAGKVSSLSQTAEDVTDAYGSLTRKREALLAERTRLLALMEAESSETIVKYILPQLAEVEASLSEIEAKLNDYDDRIDYSRISVAVIENGNTSAKIEIKEAFLSGWNFVKNVFLFLVNAVVFLLPVAVIAVPVALIIVFTGKKKRKKRAEKQAALAAARPMAEGAGMTSASGTTGEAPAQSASSNAAPGTNAARVAPDLPQSGNPYAKGNPYAPNDKPDEK